jgi:hypothetical protein
MPSYPQPTAAHALYAPGQTASTGLQSVVDDARQLLTDMGLRPYRVFTVIVEWSGSDMGLGTESVVSETEFLPTPLVSMRPIGSEMNEGGQVERGNTELKEISGRYTEDQIRGLFQLQALPKNQLSYVEVFHDARDGQLQPRRRFQVTGVPWHDAENFQWVVKLTESDPDRRRDGSIIQPTVTPPRVFRP